MVSYEIQTAPKARSGWIRATPRDVLKWFDDSGASTRLEFVCGLLHLCSPSELRFFGSCLEELARLHYEDLRELESLSNSITNATDEEPLSALVTESRPLEVAANDNTTCLDQIKISSKHLGLHIPPPPFFILASNAILRSQMIFRLSLLKSTNLVSAGAYFKALVPDTVSFVPTTESFRTPVSLIPHTASKWGPTAFSSSDENEEEPSQFVSLSSSEKAVFDEILLIYTLAAFHPAFTFEHRQRLSTCLFNLRTWSKHIRSEARPLRSCNPSTHHHNHHFSLSSSFHIRHPHGRKPANCSSSSGNPRKSSCGPVCECCFAEFRDSSPVATDCSMPVTSSSNHSKHSCTSSGGQLFCARFGCFHPQCCCCAPPSLHNRSHSFPAESQRTSVCAHVGYKHFSPCRHIRCNEPDFTRVACCAYRSGPTTQRAGDSVPSPGRRRFRSNGDIVNPIPIPKRSDSHCYSSDESANSSDRCAPDATDGSSCAPCITHHNNNYASALSADLHAISSSSTVPSIADIARSSDYASTHMSSAGTGDLRCSSINCLDAVVASSSNPGANYTGRAVTSQPEELGPTPTTTLTASDGIALVKNLVSTDLFRLSGTSVSVSSMSSHPSGSQLPVSSRLLANEVDFRFRVGKHTKNAMEFCVVAPKHHSSGSSPISTPPSEDSGSETRTHIVSTSCLEYWRPKAFVRSTTNCLPTLPLCTSHPTISASMVTNTFTTMCCGSLKPTCTWCSCPEPLAHRPAPSTLEPTPGETDSTRQINSHQRTALHSEANTTPPWACCQRSHLPPSVDRNCQHTVSHSGCMLSSSFGSGHVTCELTNSSCALVDHPPRTDVVSTVLSGNKTDIVCNGAVSVTLADSEAPDIIQISSCANHTGDHNLDVSPATLPLAPPILSASTSSNLSVSSSANLAPISVVVSVPTPVISTLPVYGSPPVTMYSPAFYRFPHGCLLPPTQCWAAPSAQQSGTSLPVLSPGPYFPSYFIPPPSNVYIPTSQAPGPVFPPYFAPLNYPQWTTLHPCTPLSILHTGIKSSSRVADPGFGSGRTVGFTESTEETETDTASSASSSSSIRSQLRPQTESPHASAPTASCANAVPVPPGFLPPVAFYHTNSSTSSQLQLIPVTLSGGISCPPFPPVSFMQCLDEAASLSFTVTGASSSSSLVGAHPDERTPHEYRPISSANLPPQSITAFDKQPAPPSHDVASITAWSSTSGRSSSLEDDGPSDKRVASHCVTSATAQPEKSEQTSAQSVTVWSNSGIPSRAYPQHHPVTITTGGARNVLPAHLANMVFYAPPHGASVGVPFIHSPVTPFYPSTASISTSGSQQLPPLTLSVNFQHPPSAFGVIPAPRNGAPIPILFTEHHPPNPSSVTSVYPISHQSATLSNMSQQSRPAITCKSVLSTVSVISTTTTTPTVLSATTSILSTSSFPSSFTSSHPPPYGQLRPQTGPFFPTLSGQSSTSPPGTFSVPIWPSTSCGPRNLSCYSCGLTGHKAKHCPSRISAQQSADGVFQLNCMPSK